MPILTSTPAALPVYDQEAFYPHIDKADDVGPGFFAGFNADRWIYRRGLVVPPGGSTQITQVGPGVGGTGVLKRYEVAAGIAYALRFSTTSAVAGECIRPPMLFNAYDPAAAAGALVGRSDLRVFWWREVWQYTGGFGDGGCGHAWSWDVPNTAAFHWAQAGDLFQQHGIFGNGAGGLEYRSYSAAAALLETVAIPGVALGSWIMADHQFIAWAPGRAASYELRVNGASIVQRDYGSGVLPFPVATGAARLQLSVRMSSAGGIWFLASVHVKAGRFTMDGLELRS